MKKSFKLLAVLALLPVTAFICFAGCKRSSPKTHTHVYDDNYDATCNTCGHNRVPATRPVPDDEDNTDKDNTEGKFIIDEATDGLILEGLDPEYALTKQNPSFDFTAEEVKVYLSANGVKGEAVPDKHYNLTVTYGGKIPENLSELTADGTYNVTVVLKDICYEGGEAVTQSIFKVEQFKVVNPVVEVRLKSGTVTQYCSKTDKISGSWTFEGVRANGVSCGISAGEVKISALVTDVAGTHTASVEYGDIVSKVEYTIKPMPQVIKGVEVTFDNSEKFVTDGGKYTLSADDFDVSVTADTSYAYTAEKVIKYGNAESKTVELPAGDEPHSVTLKITFTYTVENEKVTETTEKQFTVKVTEQVAEPENKNLVADGAAIGALGENLTIAAVLAENENGAISVAPADDVTLSAVTGQEVDIGGKILNTALYVAGKADNFPTYKGLSLALNAPAIVNVYVSVSADEFATVSAEDGDGVPYDPATPFPGSGSAVVTFNFTKAGNYSLVFLGNVKIYCVEAVFA